jgi:aspartate aminotransferase-like enzyme
MYTKNTIILSTSSGSGLMEGAIRSCTRKRAAVFSVGAFGDRWFKMAKTNGVPADKISSVPGKPTTPEMVDEALSTGKYDVITVTQNETSAGLMNPVDEIGALLKSKYPDVLFLVDTVSSMGGTKIEVDKWGIDVCITSTQKCLGLPAGMSICSVSNRAIEAARQVENRGLYFDLVELYDTIQKKDHQYPSTPSLPHMFALDYQLDRILTEGLENRFARHKEMAQYVRDWAKKYFALFVEDEKYLSNTLTTIKNTRGISVGDLNKKLGERGFMISNGYGDLKEVTFRISHMADYTLDEVKDLISNINDILGLK